MLLVPNVVREHRRIVTSITAKSYRMLLTSGLAMHSLFKIRSIMISPICARISHAFVSAALTACNGWRFTGSHRASHFDSAVPVNTANSQIIKNALKNYARLAKLGVLAALVLAPFSAVNTVVAYPESSPQFPVDRWDPGWTERDIWRPGMMGPGQRNRMTRHLTFMNEGVPPEYRGKLNPLAPTGNVIQSGGMLYQQQCAVCHGAEGMGDGDAAYSVNPSPALLAYMIQRPQSVDEYLMWSISEGGKAFGTAMPVFKGKLSQEKIWKIITFMRAGFPSLENN